MKKRAIKTFVAAVLLWGAASAIPSPCHAGSCCGGGGSSSLVVPKGYLAVTEASFELEKYDGFWDQGGNYTKDPPGSDLRQYRINLGYGQRLAKSWQASLTAPYVWNINKYSGKTSRSRGVGDTALGVLYEAVDERSAWRLRSWSDAVPSVTLGPSLLIPTGKSPYDDETSSFDVTGRGFYRLDANLLVDKSLLPFNASLALSYGMYVPREVNREYGKYVEPYKKKLGDRFTGSLSTGYTYYMGTGGDALTATLGASYTHEEDGEIDGRRDPTTGFKKTGLSFGLGYMSTDHDWKVKLGWAHGVNQDGWGENFPVTDVVSLGVKYAFR